MLNELRTRMPEGVRFATARANALGAVPFGANEPRAGRDVPRGGGGTRGAVEEAHALLERAHDEMRGGKQSLALDRGRMVHELVFNAVSHAWRPTWTRSSPGTACPTWRGATSAHGGSIVRPCRTRFNAARAGRT